MKFAIVICSIPGFIHSECFREVADTIDYGLKKLGFTSCITDSVFMDGYQHIILGSHLIVGTARPPQFPQDSILYNLEQLEKNSEFWINGYLSLLQKYTVWDYSPQNSEYLRSLGITVKAIVPISYSPVLEIIKQQREKDIDVLFIGSVNPRRKAVFSSMRALGLEVVTLFGCYGAERNGFISRAKVLLNVHLYEAKILEMVRISFYLANKCCVLSEESSLPKVDKEWGEGVVFGNYHALPSIADSLIKNDIKRRAVARRGLSFIKKRKIELALRDSLHTLNF